MTNTEHTNITRLIEQHIRDEVRGSADKAVDAFAAVLDAELYKLDVHPLFTCMAQFVDEVRTKHINNLVNKRIDELVERLVQSEQAAPQAEPEASTFQVGDKVMLRSGGPEMAVCATLPNGDAVCQWERDGVLQSASFPLVCLTCFGAR